MALPIYMFSDWSNWTADDGRSGVIDWNDLKPTDLHPGVEAIRQALREAQEMVVFAMPERDQVDDHTYALANAPFFRAYDFLRGSMLDCESRELPFVQAPWWRRDAQVLTETKTNPECARFLFRDQGGYGAFFLDDDVRGIHEGCDLMRLLVVPNFESSDASMYGAVASTAPDGTRAFDGNMTAPLACGFWKEFPHPTNPDGRLWRSYVSPEASVWSFLPGLQKVMSLACLTAIKETIQRGFKKTIFTSRFPASYAGRRMIGQDRDTVVEVRSRRWGAWRPSSGWWEWFWPTGDKSQGNPNAPEWDGTGVADWDANLDNWDVTGEYRNAAFHQEGMRLGIENKFDYSGLMWVTRRWSAKAVVKSVIRVTNLPLGRSGKRKLVKLYMRTPQKPQAGNSASVTTWYGPVTYAASWQETEWDPNVPHAGWALLHEAETTEPYISFQVGDTAMPEIPEPAALPEDLAPPFSVEPPPDPWPDVPFPEQINTGARGSIGVNTYGTFFNYEHPDSQGDLVFVVEHDGFKFARMP